MPKIRTDIDVSSFKFISAIKNSVRIRNYFLYEHRSGRGDRI